MEISGQKVFITGGTAGIGLALAQGFTKLGNDVIICGRNKVSLDKITSANPKISGFIVDLNDASATKVIMKELNKRKVEPTILINNAGIGEFMDLTEGGLEKFSADITSEIRVNLHVPIELSIAFLPLLARHKESAIINITSGLAISPKSASPVYCATKTALRVFTKALRYQIDDKKLPVRIIEVLPPTVDTNLTLGVTSGKIPVEQVVKEVLLGLSKNKNEIYVGKTKLLKWLHSISPVLSDKIMRNW